MGVDYKMNKHYVYTYTDPRNGEVFYVGKGKNNRDTEHLRVVRNNSCKTRRYNKDKDYRIKNILDDGKEPLIERVFENLSDHDACNHEAGLISKYKMIHERWYTFK